MTSEAGLPDLKLIHVVPPAGDHLNMTEEPSNSTFVTDAGSYQPTTINGTSSTSAPIGAIQPCLYVLYADIGNSHVRIWDLALLIPNTLFLIFLIFKCKIAITKLRQSSSAVFFAFYAMVLTVAIISVARAVVSMMVNASTNSGDIADTVLWIIVKFFLISIEFSVIIFGLFSSMVDSKAIIKRILLATSSIALAYSVTQGALEIKFPDKHYIAPDKYDIYAHGGMLFWCISSSIFSLAYFIILILPYTKMKDKVQLPVKRSFYCYVAFLALLNLVQAIASGLVYADKTLAICVVDITSFVYFSIFAPLIYLTFLHKFFRQHKQPLLLSYNNPDEAEDEAHRLPNSYIVPSKEEPISPGPTLYNSTEFGQSPNITFGPLVIGNPMGNRHMSAQSVVENQPVASINYDEG
ncbi:transmembrane protein adipocyte-associated 1-like [Acanthaster planci]|uniref:Transmembrane protein adipocyte-associated 1-like n=1 Tax=Acanthaster planci TaxID=133434 RepID=A0A8B7XN05_ACAPL|nr:transmembrane protein adipocyte-associated 1-like [Acanthaster planci]XP_022081445.1 transmembrane protein adipocyte-associated 1-like [Acanthaster planci]XP_022081446.1 transmembrane protein adipocyte-associated 1-like [Acanthaster planci]